MDEYPLPNLSILLDNLGNYTRFFSVDVMSAFWQTKIREDQRDIFAFRTPKRMYRPLRLPFGARNSPATWVRLLDKVFEGMNHNEVYMDDILIHTSDDETHLEAIDELLQRLEDANLTLKPEKNKILVPELTYLGHIISADGAKPDPAKLEAVKNSHDPPVCATCKVSWD